MKVKRLKNEEQKSKEETEKKKPDLWFCVACDELGLFFRKPEQGGKCIGNEKRKKKEKKEDTAPILHFATFFFFFWISAWIGSFAWVDVNQPDLAQIGSSLHRVSASREMEEKKKKPRRGIDAQVMASSHVATSDASAMGVLPHPCIPASRLIDSCKNLVHNLKSIIWSSLVGKIKQIIIIIINKLLNSPKAKIIIIIIT